MSVWHAATDECKNLVFRIARLSFSTPGTNTLAYTHNEVPSIKNVIRKVSPEVIRR